MKKQNDIKSHHFDGWSFQATHIVRYAVVLGAALVCVGGKPVASRTSDDVYHGAGDIISDDSNVPVSIRSTSELVAFSVVIPHVADLSKQPNQPTS